MQTFYIIGISDDRNQFLSPEIRNLVSQGKVFSGGKRHHELVHAYLPEDAVWIDITVPLDAVFSRYEEHPEIIVFASGDPLFFGFANTVIRLSYSPPSTRCKCWHTVYCSPIRRCRPCR